MTTDLEPIATPPPARRWRMRAWAVLIAGLVIAGAAAIYYADGEPGYVLVTFKQFSLETSVWFAVLALVAAYFALRALGGVWRALFGARGWWAERRSRRARERTTAGLLALLHGDWAAARKQLLASVTATDEPALNLIFAAQAANAEGNRRQADQYLQQAQTRLPANQPAAALMRLQQILDAGGEPPISELQQLYDRAPRSPGVLRALAQALERGQQWSALRALLPDLRKQSALAAEALIELDRRIFRGVARSATNLDELKRMWADLARGDRNDPPRVLAYALSLQRLGGDADAEPVVREALDNQWQYQLVTLYGLLRVDTPRQAKQAERWLAQHADDGALLQALGRLQAANGDWQQARTSFDAALNVLKTRGADNWGSSAQHCSVELAEAMLQLGDVEAAKAQLRAAQA